MSVTFCNIVSSRQCFEIKVDDIDKLIGHHLEHVTKIFYLKHLSPASRKYFKFLCINDLMDHTKPESVTAKKELQNFYETIYPHKSEFEI